MSDITANIVVGMPVQPFTMARSFKSAANGKVFIGLIDTDPTNPENQIQVYLEDENGALVPVSQPIRINAGGYPVYNGQVAKFVTVKGHSMAIYDAYNVQQFYFANVLKYDPDQLQQRLADSGDGLGDYLVAVKQPFTWGAIRNQHEKNADTISAMDVSGMKGNGVDDDTAAFTALESVISGRVIDLAFRTYQVDTPPVGNIYINGRFLTNSLDTGLPIILEMGSNAAVLSSTSDTGEYEEKYFNGLSGDFQESGRTNRDLFAVIASQNSRAFGLPRSVTLGSIYSYSKGNVSGTYSARQCRSLIPQSVNIGSEDCRIENGFRGLNACSIASKSTGESSGNIGSRRGWATGLATWNIASVDASAGAGHGAILVPVIIGGVITSVSIINGGTLYSNNGTIMFYDRTGTGVGASCTYTVDSVGVITSVTVINGGSGYSDNTQVNVLESSAYSVNIATTNHCAVYGEASANIASNNSLVKSKRSVNIAATNSNAITSDNAVNIATDTCSASGLQSANIATANSIASGPQSAIIAGGGNTASAAGAVVIGGNNSVADLQSAVVMGRRTKARAVRTLVAGDSAVGIASTANIKFEVVMGNGNVNIAGTLTQNVAFTDIAKMFENVSVGEIPVGSLVSWEGRKVRLARKGDVNVSVHSRTYANLLGDSQFTWAGRYLRDDFGQILTKDIPDPDWQEKIPDPEWEEKIINPLHPVYEKDMVLDENSSDTGEYLTHIVSEQFIDNPEPQPWIDNPEPRKTITVRQENPDYDPSKEQVPRSERLREWTPVALVGEVHTMVDDTVKANDFIMPGDVSGRGTKSEVITKLRVMEVTVPYDSNKGYAIALCLIY